MKKHSPTNSQIGRKIHRKKPFRLTRCSALEGCPQKRGVVSRVRIMKPKKPNSAQRKIAKIRLSTMRRVNCYIGGLGNNLRDYSQVLVRGGRVKDLPGIQYHLIRGKFDFNWRERENYNRTRSLTKYGIPKSRSDFF